MQSVLSKFKDIKFILIQTVGKEFPTIDDDIKEHLKNYKNNILGLIFDLFFLIFFIFFNFMFNFNFFFIFKKKDFIVVDSSTELGFKELKKKIFKKNFEEEDYKKHEKFLKKIFLLRNENFISVKKKKYLKLEKKYLKMKN
jgi:hypothetical protein